MTNMLQDLAVGHRKQQVKDVPRGAIVRFEGEWGVLGHGRWLDRWDGGPIKLKPTNVVDVLNKRRDA